VKAELLGGERPVAGRLDVRGGGVAFVPSAGSAGFAIAPAELRWVGPATPRGDAIPSAATTQRLMLVGPSVRRVVRVDANAGWDLVRALADERNARGLADIPIATAGGIVVSPPGAPPGPGAPEPDPSERRALPAGSLPDLWLRLTAGASRARALHVDGTSMLVELALAGPLDVTVAGSLRLDGSMTGNAALDGAIRRIEGRRPSGPPFDVAGWLGAYVGGLEVDQGGDGEARRRAREAPAAAAPPDPRAAALVWLVAQDAAMGAVAAPSLSTDGPDARSPGRPPPVEVHGDAAATARVGRVLVATVPRSAWGWRLPAAELAWLLGG
jgi:hypothetical protein